MLLLMFDAGVVSQFWAASVAGLYLFACVDDNGADDDAGFYADDAGFDTHEVNADGACCL